MLSTSFVALALFAAAPAAEPPKAAETQTAENPKHGGTLTYVIPADAPPSFDGHRKTTSPRCNRSHRSIAT
jgi:peptide/nickel transport system substrate-binding protein